MGPKLAIAMAIGIGAGAALYAATGDAAWIGMGATLGAIIAAVMYWRRA